MLTHRITDPRAWQASTIDDRQSWYLRLSDRLLNELDDRVHHLRDRPTQDWLAVPPFESPELAPASRALEEGRGFVIIQAPPEQFPAQELTAVYWLVGRMLGQPCAQNVEGALLYDVRDTGQDVRYGARFSVTNAESTFHTDNSFGEELLDYVGLLCLNPSRSGGLSQVVSALSVHNELVARHPDVLDALYRSYHIDRRGGLKPGDSPTIEHPVLQWDGQELVCRYLRYWIEVGQEKAGAPLGTEQKRAFDIFDDVLNQRSLRVEFDLKPGDMYFINNRWILHNRTAFEDHPEPERKRHLVRLWLTSVKPAEINSAAR